MPILSMWQVFMLAMVNKSGYNNECCKNAALLLCPEPCIVRAVGAQISGSGPVLERSGLKDAPV